MFIIPTLKIARAAGQDAGNRSMLTAGRTSWNQDDWNAAADTTEQLLACTCPDCGGSTRNALPQDPSRKSYQPGCVTCGGIGLNRHVEAA